MKTLFLAGIALSVTILNASCKKDNTDPATSAQNDIRLASSATFGKYITNKDGKSLYMFSNDADGANTCTGGCEALWPAFTGDLSTATFDAGLTKSDFATITTSTGKKQLTYKGWPLYTYSAEGTGTTSGDGVDGIWFVAKPDYNIMLANKQLKGLDGNNYKSDYTVGAANTIYFTNGSGRTLYTFSVDSFNINKFTKPDLSNNNVFPIYEQDTVIAPSVLNKALFGKIVVGGKKQMTYNGWPLYHFSQDSVRGLTLAVSVPTPGKWPVAVKNVAEAAK